MRYDDRDNSQRQRQLRLQAAVDAAFGNMQRAKELERQALSLLMEAEDYLRRLRPSLHPGIDDG